MKVTLIQTPWSDASHREFKGIAKRYALYPPLGLLCLAAAVEKAGHQADVIDLEARDMLFDDLVTHIKESGSDLIGLTVTSPVFHLGQALAGKLRERLPQPIVVGGPHITVLKSKTFTHHFDFAAIQEGGETLVELMNALAGARDFSQIKGLLWRNNDGTIVENAPRPFVRDLDSLPPPAREKLDPTDYVFEVPDRGVIPVATIELTRGCPFKCVFCSEPLNTGRALRKRTAKSVVDEMISVKEQFGISHFMTLDSTLTLNRKLIEAFCEELIRRNAGVTWEGQTRANLVDEEFLILMQRAGLVRMSFGLESSNREVLRLMKKEVEPEAMGEAYRLCKKLGISTLTGVMIGNPGDTRESVMETARFIRSIPEIRYAPCAIAIPYPGTELAQIAEMGMYGLKLLTKDYSKYSRYAGGVMEVNGMGPAELLSLQRRALFVMHSTPGKILGLIQHFGFKNLLQIGLKMLASELTVMFGGREPMLVESIAENNTTLKSLGVTYNANGA